MCPSCAKGFSSTELFCQRRTSGVGCVAAIHVIFAELRGSNYVTQRKTAHLPHDCRHPRSTYKPLEEFCRFHQHTIGRITWVPTEEPCRVQTPNPTLTRTLTRYRADDVTPGVLTGERAGNCANHKVARWRDQPHRPCVIFDQCYALCTRQPLFLTRHANPSRLKKEGGWSRRSTDKNHTPRQTLMSQHGENK
jgi:hypothetical protein